jgi:hypothetical protein
MAAVLDPQQEIFARLKIDLESKGYDVYDGFLPPENTPYPFVYLGDFQQADTATKGAVHGSVYPVIHVWHNSPKQRGTVSQILRDIKSVCRSISHTANYSWMVRGLTNRIIPDTTTKTPLLHGIVEAEFLFS